MIIGNLTSKGILGIQGHADNRPQTTVNGSQLA